MEAITELVALTIEGEPTPSSFGHSSWEDVLGLRAGPEEIASAWKQAMDADDSSVWSSAIQRAVFLAALGGCFEIVKERDFKSINRALGAMTTRSGGRMSVIGSRCELFSRAAEALYKEGRRRPMERDAQLMLFVAEAFFTVVLSDCRGKDDPRYWPRWRGMRGVSRLMLAVHADSNARTQSANPWQLAATDLRLAFDAGNRGASAATYLLDALVHQVEIDPSVELFHQIESTISDFSPDEMASRSVLALAGQYWFYRSFHEAQPQACLESAVACFDKALGYSQQLAHDDAFVRLTKGQAQVRLSMCLESLDDRRAMQALGIAIEDLKFAAEAMPEKYLSQSSLPSALVTRSDKYARGRQYDDARRDLQYLRQARYRGVLDSSTASQVSSRLLSLDIKEALDKDDPIKIEAALAALLQHSEGATGNLIIGALAAKRLFVGRSATDDPSLLRRVIKLMEDQWPETSTSAAHQQQHASLLATLQYTLGRVWDHTSLDSATETFVRALALHGGTPPVELRSIFADCALHTARFHLRQGRVESAEILLRDAADALLSLIDLASQPEAQMGEAFDLTVAYSKAGEALHRLASSTYDREDGLAAIQYMERARELGNNSHQLLGLLGDAYYRVYRRDRRAEHLSAASEYKRLAREVGGTSRENLSLSARLAHQQYQLTGAETDLLSSIELVAGASDASPTWPWPPFQLFESLERLAATEIARLVSQLPEICRERPLVKLLITHGREGLAAHGCKLVLDDDEFAQLRLAGGRQPVYVVEDAHALLGSSYVFKHTDAENAKRDMDVNNSFSTFLRSRNIRGLYIPRPVAIVPNDDRRGVVYVMRRARGFHLGRIAIRARKHSEPVPVDPFERALSFLAAFHAWGETVRVSPSMPILGFVRSSLVHTLGKTGWKLPPLAQETLMGLGNVPAFIKKDAHPENWLIDDSGNLVMLDFENSRSVPAVLEVVQLLDDYPLFSANELDWSARICMCNAYLAQKESLSPTAHPLDIGKVDALYAVFAVTRAAFGIKRITGPAGAPTNSSSALMSRGIRLTQYHQNLEFLGGAHSDHGVRALAVSVRDKLAELVQG